MKIITGFTLLALACLFACVNGKRHPSDYQSIAQEKLGGEISNVFSPDSTYVLSYVEKEGTNKYPQNNIHFIVQRLNNLEVVYEDVLDNGSVSFYNDTELKIVLIPGMMKKGQTLDDFTYLYDLKSKEKRSFRNVSN